VDNEPKLAVSFGIDSIPTLIIVKNGEIAGKLVGYNSKTIVETFINKTI
jgi:thioredoxin-like negative regulator of GroEL